MSSLAPRTRWPNRRAALCAPAFTATWVAIVLCVAYLLAPLMGGDLSAQMARADFARAHPSAPGRPALVRRHPALRVLAVGAGRDGGADPAHRRRARRRRVDLAHDPADPAGRRGPSRRRRHRCRGLPGQQPGRGPGRVRGRPGLRAGRPRPADRRRALAPAVRRRRGAARRRGESGGRAADLAVRARHPAAPTLRRHGRAGDRERAAGRGHGRPVLRRRQPAVQLLGRDPGRAGQRAGGGRRADPLPSRSGSGRCSDWSWSPPPTSCRPRSAATRSG